MDTVIVNSVWKCRALPLMGNMQSLLCSVYSTPMYVMEDERPGHTVIDFDLLGTVQKDVVILLA
jgi:hypothetical protein